MADGTFLLSGGQKLTRVHLKGKFPWRACFRFAVLGSFNMAAKSLPM
jgi:hypothetical protein